MIIPNRETRLGADFGLPAPYDAMTMVELYEIGRGAVRNLIGEYHCDMELPFDRDKKISEETSRLNNKMYVGLPEPAEVVEIIQRSKELAQALVDEKQVLSSHRAVAVG